MLVTNAQATVSENQAFFNTKLGVDVAPGDTDAGGNKAGGNAALHRCADVVCS